MMATVNSPTCCRRSSHFAMTFAMSLSVHSTRTLPLYLPTTSDIFAPSLLVWPTRPDEMQTLE